MIKTNHPFCSPFLVPFLANVLVSFCQAFMFLCVSNLAVYLQLISTHIFKGQLSRLAPMVIMDDLHSYPVYLSSFSISFSDTCILNQEC